MTYRESLAQVYLLRGVTIVLLCLAGCSTQATVTPDKSKASTDHPRTFGRDIPFDSSEADSEKPSDNAFDGEWAVRWCDISDPDRDCGGFFLSLVQRDNQLCGSFDGARVGLAQVDEGGLVLGVVRGNAAMLTIESERSGNKYAALAVLEKGQIRWELGETLRAVDEDIDIIALKDTLDRRPLEADAAVKHEQVALDCEKRWSQG